jgi:N-carbamoyl-L-amino-acid hydrolase
VTFDPDTVLLVEKTAKRLGYSVHRLPSGAGHDAQMMARLSGGDGVHAEPWWISHNPAEHTDPEHLEAGANVLLQVLLELAEREEA